MAWTAEQRRTHQFASMYGYKTAVMENTVPPSEISVGDGIIVLTDKGEPIMTGKVDEAKDNSFRIGEEWYSSSRYSFRRV